MVIQESMVTEETDETQGLKLSTIKLCQVIKYYSGQKAGKADQR